MKEDSPRYGKKTEKMVDLIGSDHWMRRLNGLKSFIPRSLPECHGLIDWADSVVGTNTAMICLAAGQSIPTVTVTKTTASVECAKSLCLPSITLDQPSKIGEEIEHFSFTSFEEMFPVLRKNMIGFLSKFGLSPSKSLVGRGAPAMTYTIDEYGRRNPDNDTASSSGPI
jgi:hypothetical protein